MRSLRRRQVLDMRTRHTTQSIVYFVLLLALVGAAWPGSTARPSFGATQSRELALAPVEQVRKPAPPKIFRHPNMRAEATSSRGAIVRYRPAKVQGAKSVRYSKASGSLFRLGTTIVRIVAKNKVGLSRASFTVRVVDTTAPTVGAIADLRAEATSPQGATVTYASIRATDRVSANVLVSCSPASGTVFGLGETRVSCEARDAAGNHAGASFVVTVVDTTAPVFASVADVTAAATSAGGAAVGYPAVKATDTASANVEVTCSPPSGSVFPVGQTTVSCTARDAAGNSAAVSFRVVVNRPVPPGVVPSGRYSGTTSQGKPISFSITSDGFTIASVNIGWHYTCSATDSLDSQFFTSAPISIGWDGGFTHSATGSASGGGTAGTYTMTLGGSFAGSGGVTGTTQSHQSLTAPGSYECDTGTVSWSATLAQ